MDNDLFEKGLAKRKGTLGAEYVEKNLAAADDFTRPFQEAMTAWCWGFGWGDEVIEPKTRSMMNLAMIGALGKMHEWEIHCRGALNNGQQRRDPGYYPRGRYLLWRAAISGMLSRGTQGAGRGGRAITGFYASPEPATLTLYYRVHRLHLADRRRGGSD